MFTYPPTRTEKEDTYTHVCKQTHTYTHLASVYVFLPHSNVNVHARAADKEQAACNV